jgi:succinate dehydrogenase hydrophobic anchor subunit
LLLAIRSLRASAIAAVLLLVAHVYTEVYVYKGGLSADTLWGADKALDKLFWIAVFLLVASALLPGKLRPKDQPSN